MSAGVSDNLISVIIPAYNAGKYISCTLESASKQTHRDLEIIVVDDGSTDETVSLVESAAAKDSRITLVKTSRGGASRARNIGIARSRGQYIAPLDADDLWQSTKLARQFEILQSAREDIGLVYCWAAGIDESGRIVLPVWNSSRARGNVLREIVMSGILSCGSTPLIRREYVEQVGGYDEELTLSEDWKYYTALADVCSFEVIPECLTGYRVRSDSTSMNVPAMEEALKKCTAWIRSRWPDLPKAVLDEREFTLHTYLAFLAIRAGEYWRVHKSLWRAIKARPQKLLGGLFWQLIALTPAHAIGLRRYEWKFWTRAAKFPD